MKFSNRYLYIRTEIHFAYQRLIYRKSVVELYSNVHSLYPMRVLPRSWGSSLDVPYRRI